MLNPELLQAQEHKTLNLKQENENVLFKNGFVAPED